MLRKMLCTGLVMAVAVGFAAAEEIRGVITKVEDGKVTFASVKFKKGEKPEKGEAKTLPVAANVKVLSGKFNKETFALDAGEPLEGGLKNEKLKNIGDRGVGATIITDASGKNITEIRVSPGFKGKRKKDAN